MAAQAVRAWLANGYTGSLKVEVRRRMWRRGGFRWVLPLAAALPWTVPRALLAAAGAAAAAAPAAPGCTQL